MTPKTMQWGTVKTPEEERVPIGLVSALIHRWHREFGALHEEPSRGHNADAGYVSSKDNHEGVLALLSFHVGINARKLRQIKNGKYEIGSRSSGNLRVVDWVPFDIADKIVCGTVGPMAWHTEPLNRYYGPLTVKPSEREYEAAA